jgi:hypothetical protein
MRSCRQRVASVPGMMATMASLPRRALLFPRLAVLWLELRRADQAGRRHEAVFDEHRDWICPVCHTTAPCGVARQVDAKFEELHKAFTELGRKAMS